MVIEKGKWGTVHETLRRLALSVVNPEDSYAYSNCCHHYTASFMRENGDNVPDDARIILLGFRGKAETVAHSIIVDANDEIISDSMSMGDGASAAFRTAVSPSYTHPKYDHLPLFQSYMVLEDKPLGEFRAEYLHPMAEEIPPPGG